MIAATPGSDIETPEAALIAKADAARVQTALAALPAAFRETLVLRDLQGFDYREIAAITGVPVGTVMSRLARARDGAAEVLHTLMSQSVLHRHCVHGLRRRSA
jgi:RNA polymerase sigma factor (sigma-70 family)